MGSRTCCSWFLTLGRLAQYLLSGDLDGQGGGMVMSSSSPSCCRCCCRRLWSQLPCIPMSEKESGALERPNNQYNLWNGQKINSQVNHSIILDFTPSQLKLSQNDGTISPFPHSLSPSPNLLFFVLSVAQSYFCLIVEFKTIVLLQPSKTKKYFIFVFFVDHFGGSSKE